ncbi:MAG: methylenetetrahydrofolate reductase [NAD(P)H] [Verrucomicrobia bacterium]|jgi:methylenetetrahydrofolate reductase (NADPH)|nr:methylenetetrahydrofolate reductase [NAD(P)H] [Verrucomicrobiota bacterium]OQC67168.1 MAG: 5,10-methylenetetrahydrofolate reductase [Verrucomicrobia bacterium ADurb.Bin006]MDI9379961.1 methylenetetrahydrofolate reductase [NAD(P)H] [Verrucomicrobiota bacterium]NMD19216.1 methylenetetrahydrofolate reductase [NAD(P)H] [Verrucomicrobiota bacterium]HNV00727.1 methylenetetrahydrofolate reductase [NAD(P)H] [Verrucomicrobiota bacterium]
MRFIHDIYSDARQAGRPVFSFEFFTPKTESGDRAIFERTLPALCRLAPSYCSVTYGAGGSTRAKTLQMVERIQLEFGVPAMAHLTCVGSTRDQIVALLDEARSRGISNILALRGDPPEETGRFVRSDGGFEFAHELVTLTRDLGGFSIGVAGFPEGHLECREGKEVDWRRLAAKIGCGARFVITQLFFDNAFFYEFRDYLVGTLGITVPIVPGVIPILSSSQVERFVSLCGATIPSALAGRLNALGDNDADVTEFGIEFATRQCADLLRQGVPGIHFYTLNRTEPTTRIVQNLRGG